MTEEEPTCLKIAGANRHIMLPGTMKTSMKTTRAVVGILTNRSCQAGEMAVSKGIKQ
jgi:hypothetical protein